MQEISGFESIDKTLHFCHHKFILVLWATSQQWLCGAQKTASFGHLSELSKSADTPTVCNSNPTQQVKISMTAFCQIPVSWGQALAFVRSCLRACTGSLGPLAWSGTNFVSITQLCDVSFVKSVNNALQTNVDCCAVDAHCVL